MTFDADHGGPPVQDGRPATRSGTASPEMRLQILATEHWSLLASRSLAWQESFARAGMYLATLSGAVVSLALVAQADRYGEGFRLAALIVLPVVLFVGVTTFARLGGSNFHDGMCVAGMNRIRHEYVELAPDLEPVFVMSTHDDARGVGITMGVPPGRSQLPHLLSATPFVIAVVNSVVAGAVAALVVAALDASDTALGAAAAAGFVVSLAVHFWAAARSIRRGQGSLEVLYPSPETAGG
jgi:hypothetical protein